MTHSHYQNEYNVDISIIIFIFVEHTSLNERKRH